MDKKQHARQRLFQVTISANLPSGSGKILGLNLTLIISWKSMPYPEQERIGCLKNHKSGFDLPRFILWLIFNRLVVNIQP